jgi:hypothetical protein
VQVGGQYSGTKGYCTPNSDGVSYNDVTPRWGVAWDIFGTGKTSVKLNMGKYLSGASIAGIYADANPAVRAVNKYTRTWTDVDGDRIVDCDLLNFNAQSAQDICGGPTSVANQDSTRYGRDPLSLDTAGTPIGLATTQCGRNESGIPAAVKAYCDVYGDTLLSGSGKRRSEWQFGIGIQHEILPRLSAEVTYNWRKYSNLQVTDQIGIGCDRFNASVDQQTCAQNYLNFTSNTYDFYSAVAPSNPLLPNGGGYVIRGLNTSKSTLPTGQPSAVTIMDALGYTWNGVDTNFVWRGTTKFGLRGLRVNGGTTTGRAVRDQCLAAVDAPNVRQYLDAPPQCNPHTRWETNVRGTAAYTILPDKKWADVLVSTVFVWRPGVERNANHTFNKADVTWEPSSAARATTVCPTATNGTGCFTASGGTTQTTTVVNLLNSGQLYGEGYSEFDLKLGKNLRFANKRINVGVDIYNLLNNDAIRTYQDNYDVADNPATPVVERWGQATGLLSPRFARLSIQFDF